MAGGTGSSIVIAIAVPLRVRGLICITTSTYFAATTPPRCCVLLLLYCHYAYRYRYITLLVGEMRPLEKIQLGTRKAKLPGRQNCPPRASPPPFYLLSTRGAMRSRRRGEARARRVWGVGRRHCGSGLMHARRRHLNFLKNHFDLLPLQLQHSPPWSRSSAVFVCDGKCGIRYGNGG